MKHTLVLPLVRIYDNVTSVVGEYKKRAEYSRWAMLSNSNNIPRNCVLFQSMTKGLCQLGEGLGKNLPQEGFLDSNIFPLVRLLIKLKLMCIQYKNI